MEGPCERIAPPTGHMVTYRKSDRRVEKQTYPFQQTDERQRLFEGTQVKSEARSQHFLMWTKKHNGEGWDYAKETKVRTHTLLTEIMKSVLIYLFIYFFPVGENTVKIRSFTCVTASMVSLWWEGASEWTVPLGFQLLPDSLGVFTLVKTFLPLQRTCSWHHVTVDGSAAGVSGLVRGRRCKGCGFHSLISSVLSHLNQ